MDILIISAGGGGGGDTYMLYGRIKISSKGIDEDLGDMSKQHYKYAYKWHLPVSTSVKWSIKSKPPLRILLPHKDHWAARTAQEWQE